MTNEDRIVVIHQPDFIPYLGFFDRLVKADVYVVLDNVQYVRHSSRSWTSRDKIKTLKGEKWISVSTQKAELNTPINKILLSDNINWKENNLNLIKENYRRCDYFDEVFPYIEKLYSFEGQRMMDFTLNSIKMLIGLFDIDIDIVIASDLDPVGKNNTLIIDIMQKLGCRNYLSGTGARDYYVSELYEQAGINVIWQDFIHPVYPQQFGDFIPYLSSIDLLFNCGIKESRKILKENYLR